MFKYIYTFDQVHYFGSSDESFWGQLPLLMIEHCSEYVYVKEDGVSIVKEYKLISDNRLMDVTSLSTLPVVFPEDKTKIQNMSQPEPDPIPNNHPAVWDLVISDMKERDQSGEKKYGTRLQGNNGRNPLVDAYQEALDLVVYLRQAIYERDCLKNITSGSPAGIAGIAGIASGDSSMNLMGMMGETKKAVVPENKKIEVCDNCFRACCWYGEFMCDNSITSGTVVKTVKELRQIQQRRQQHRQQKESEEYWSDEYMTKLFGEPAPYGYKEEDNKKLEIPKCMVCGKPATNFTQEVIELPDDGSGYKNFRGGLKSAGCDDHPVK